MNLRVEDQSLRFRISKAELEMLCSGQALTQSLFLPHQQEWHITINTQPQESLLLLHCEGTHLALHVQQAAAESLYQALPSREGLHARQSVDATHQLELILEVDIRTQKRKR